MNTHYEMYTQYTKDPVQYLYTLWSDIVEDMDLCDSNVLIECMSTYELAVQEYAKRFEVASLASGKRPSNTCLRASNEYRRVLIQAERFVPVLESLYDNLEHPTYSVAMNNSLVKSVQYLIEEDYKRTGLSLSTTATACRNIVHHAIYTFQRYGKRVYTVSPALRLLLENTHVKGFPTDQLRLPHPAIYIQIPPTYPVFHERTGYHISEGVYLVEDDQRSPRVWRLLLIGGLSLQSTSEEDDAFYHWSIPLPDGGTVEDAIQAALDVADNIAAGQRTIETKVAGKKVTMHYLPEGADPVALGSHFEKMKPTLLRLFRYVMNVVLYATNNDADITFCDANPEFEALKRRADKLPKGKKKDKLLERMRAIGTRPRILLGRDIVVDRMLLKEATEGSKHGSPKVRFIVSGHWHMYHTGEGRTVSLKKWVRPYYKGPELAPLTEGRTTLK